MVHLFYNLSMSMSMVGWLRLGGHLHASIHAGAGRVVMVFGIGIVFLVIIIIIITFNDIESNDIFLYNLLSFIALSFI